MTAALFLLDDGRLTGAAVGDLLVLEGPEGRHAATVKRIGVGESVLISDGSGTIAQCETEQVAGDRLDLRIVDLRDERPPAPRFTLVQALAKAGRDDQAIEAATELGVDEIVPWQADRSIVQWKGNRGEKASGKWQQVVRAAAKQSRRATVPVIAPVLDRKHLAGLTDRGTVVVLHEDATEPIGAVDPTGSDEVVVVVGPEGGISPAELDLLVGAGARVVRLGPHVLRSSSAGPAAIAVLMAATRWAAPSA